MPKKSAMWNSSAPIANSKATATRITGKARGTSARLVDARRNAKARASAIKTISGDTCQNLLPIASSDSAVVPDCVSSRRRRLPNKAIPSSTIAQRANGAKGRASAHQAPLARAFFAGVPTDAGSSAPWPMSGARRATRSSTGAVAITAAALAWPRPKAFQVSPARSARLSHNSGPMAITK